jgi:hypothetical protein
MIYFFEREKEFAIFNFLFLCPKQHGQGNSFGKKKFQKKLPHF